jgi:hypothetical protein
MQINLSQVLTSIAEGKKKGEIKAQFLLSVSQYKALMSHPKVVAAFEKVAQEKEEAKNAKKNSRKLEIVDDTEEVSVKDAIPLFEIGVDPTAATAPYAAEENANNESYETVPSIPNF